SLQFRGREMAYPELGSRILDDVIEQISHVGKVETQARLEGRSMTMVLVPEKKSAKKKEQTESESPGRAEAPEAAVAEIAEAPIQE
ncbi:MAG: translation initiation factor, partial [Actinomycetota bacterium]